MNFRNVKLIDNINMSVQIIKNFENWPLYFLTYFGFYKNKTLMYKLRNGVKYFVATDTHSRVPMSEVWIYKTYTPIGFDIGKNDIVVDVGAHVGTFAIYAALKAKSGRVYAYEPVVDNFKLLTRNISLNKLKNIIPHNFAVSNRQGKKKIHLDDSSATASAFAGKNQKFCLVKTVRLRDIFDNNNLRKIDFLKIDCEGSEYDILLNTPQKYLKKINKISMEYHEASFIPSNRNNLKKFFKSNNFNVVVKLAKHHNVGIFDAIGMLYAHKKK